VPTRWPFEDDVQEREFRDWDTKYRAACGTKATCRLLDKGSGEVHSELRDLVALHDETTRATSPEFELA
jgi:hypothetical protein